MRLNRRHIVSLLFVPRSQAKSLATRCCRYDWSANRLELEVKRLRPKRKVGGRRPRSPESSEDAVLQLVDISQRWLHRYRTQIVESQLEKPLRRFPVVARRLQRAQRELTAVVRLAQARFHG